ncbi:MAG: Na+/H+ antiporter NhaC family protein [Bacteroidetes bacterium]|nr:MAG: Na+/H+ antiporter NhaC family protein [Bacteroidota bacterium]
MRLFSLLFLFLGLTLNNASAASSVVLEGIAVQGSEASISIHAESTITGVNPQTEALQSLIGFSGDTTLSLNQNQVADGQIKLEFTDGSKSELNWNWMPGVLSIVPPLIAILLAILLKEVIVSLFIGILSGVFIAVFYAGKSMSSAFFDTITGYIIPALNDEGHLSVIVFSLLIGGMVAIISKNGGMAGLVHYISRYAKTAKGGQLATWLLGILIFFDDYANTLVVGNTMRPVTDRLKISREKLAYLVDSTAAPIASIAFVTTWIGAQLDYIQEGIHSLPNLNASPYSVFMDSLAYAFYPFFTLFFMFLLIWKNKDFGPMWKIEQRTRKEGVQKFKVSGHNEAEELEPEEGVKQKSRNALIPVVTLIIATISGLLYTGWSAEVWQASDMGFFKKLSLIIGAADSYKALLWSSLLGVTISIILSVGQRIMTLHHSIQVMFKGFGFMLQAIVILTLAWTLSSLTEHLHTAGYLTSALQAANASPFLLPAFTFILSALVSFSTGSSWSTMAILYPILLPASWLLCESQGMDSNAILPIFFNVVSCVLTGSVLGDHCSPISDTTILSSLASSCDHLSHVKTQMPYALTVGTVALLLGTIPAALGVPSWICFAAGGLAIYLIIRIFGREV